MRTLWLASTALLFCVANAGAQATHLTSDPLTGLPLIPATDARQLGNAPVAMPDSRVCKSAMKGNFYKVYDYFAPTNITLGEAIAWYTAHLPGFKVVRGSDKSSRNVYYNADRTILVIVTAGTGPKGDGANVYGVAYERYQPGLSPNTVTSFTLGKIACQ